MAADLEQEQEVLLKLGYFERREITLANRQLGTDAWRDTAISNADFARKSWVVHVDGQRPSWIRVTGTDLDAFEQTIRRWDSQQTR